MSGRFGGPLDLASVLPSVAKPGEEKHPGDEHDAADAEDPEDRGMGSAKRVDEQEPQREQDERNPNPRATTAPSRTEPPSTAVPIPAGRLHADTRTTVWAVGALNPTNRHPVPFAALKLSEVTDLIAMLSGVLARIDAL
jgi:hypothetical protein